MASIEALAMAGADYLEHAIPFEAYESSDRPPHLLADEPHAGDQSLYTFNDFLVWAKHGALISVGITQ